MGTKILGIGSHTPLMASQTTARGTGEMYMAGSGRAAVSTCAEVAEESVVSLASEAIRDCLARARVGPDEIGIVILVSPILDHVLGDATRIQDAVGATRAAAYQIKGTAYAGAVMGLLHAATMRKGDGKMVLVCVDYLAEGIGDSSGDLATAMLFSHCEDDRGLLAFYHHSPLDPAGVFPIEYAVRDTQGYYREKQWARTPLVKPEGTAAIRDAVAQYGYMSMEKTLEKAHISPSDVRWFIPLNFGEVAETWREVLRVPPDRYLGTWAETNLGVVSSLPRIMMDAMEGGRFSRGDKILLHGADSGDDLVFALWKW